MDFRRRTNRTQTGDGHGDEELNQTQSCQAPLCRTISEGSLLSLSLGNFLSRIIGHILGDEFHETSSVNVDNSLWM